jgi:hypothetical protein
MDTPPSTPVEKREHVTLGHGEYFIAKSKNATATKENWWTEMEAQNRKNCGHHIEKLNCGHKYEWALSVKNKWTGKWAHRSIQNGQYCQSSRNYKASNIQENGSTKNSRELRTVS